MMDLNTVWFFLIWLLLTGYAILDGFDLGIGILHLFTRDEEGHRLNLKAIAPVWDGNEVWLLTGGGALFAAFPVVYATVFSGFYLAFILLLFALIFRAVSLEFRGQVECPVWRRWFDRGFGGGSLITSFLLGVTAGNIILGLPVAAGGTLNVSLFSLLNPYALLMGIAAVGVLAMHGATFLAMKVRGDYRDWVAAHIHRFWWVGVLPLALAGLITPFLRPRLVERCLDHPLSWILCLVVLWASVQVRESADGQNFGVAFVATSSLILSITGLIALSLYPAMVLSSADPVHSLTIYNASSSPLTLKTMLIIALIGMPLVLAYTAYVYWVFRGKILEDEGY